MSTNPPSQFSFVTVTNVNQFRDRENMRTVRRTVMNDYLTKAREDPNSTDKRAQRRPSTSRVKAESSKRQQSPRTIPQQDRARPTLLHRANTEPIKEEGSVPSFFTPSGSNFTWSSSSSAALGAGNAYDSSGTYLDLDRQILYEQHASESLIRNLPYRSAFSHVTGITDSPTIDLETLKMKCRKYFGTKAMTQHWLGVVIQTPQAYLSSLCISAPYADLMARLGHGRGKNDERQTFEVFDVVPRLIKDALNDPALRCSDSIIVAITQLFAGHLLTSDTSFIRSHQEALKSITLERGGLEKLGGNGIIAANIVLTNIEADIMHNRTPDGMYLTWIPQYLAGKRRNKAPSPEGPLYQASEHMKTVESSRLCYPETLEVVFLMQRLTSNVLDLAQLEAEEREASLDETISSAVERTAILSSIRDIIARTRDLSSQQQFDKYTPSYWIYESIRIAAAMYSRAIWHHRPLSEDSQTIKETLYWDDASASDPEALFDALQQTPILDAWEHLAGVLYWVLMVGAAVCHESSSAVTTNPRLESTQSSAIVENGLTQSQTQNESLYRSTSSSLSGSTTPTFIAHIPKQNAEEGQHQPYASSSTWQAPTPTVEQGPLFYNDCGINAEDQSEERKILAKSKRMFEEYMESRDTPTKQSREADDHASDFPQFDFGAFTFTPNTSDPYSRPATAPTPANFSFPPDLSPPTTTWTSQPAPHPSQNPFFSTPHPSPSHYPAQLRQGQGAKRARHVQEPGSQGHGRSYGRPDLALVKQYLTANAVRVSILLRFEHTAAMVSSVSNLEKVTAWLRRSQSTS